MKILDKLFKKRDCLFCGKPIDFKKKDYQKDYSNERDSGNFYIHDACIEAMEKEEK